MPLDKDRLRLALIDAFDAGMSDPDWTKEQTAAALAAAIDEYVRDAGVVDVTVDVVDPGGTPIGTGAQTGVGGLS